METCVSIITGVNYNEPDMTRVLRLATLTAIILLIMYQYFMLRISRLERNAGVPTCVTTIDPCPSHGLQYDLQLEMRTLHTDMIQEDSGISADSGVLSTNETRLACSYDVESDPSKQFPICVFNNLYLDTRANQYYTLRLRGDPIDLVPHFKSFDRLTQTQELPALPASEIQELVVLAQPAHPNYCHGFLEDLHCMFWELTLIQKRLYGLDPTKIIYWISRSSLFDEFPQNWDNYMGIADGYIQYKNLWRKDIHGVFSSHSLGFSGSYGVDNRSILQFKSILVPGHCRARTPFVNRHGMYHESRTFPFEPFPDRQQGKWMLLFGDYLLRRFNISSKFLSTGDASELLVISPRQGATRREMTNPRDMQQALQDEATQLRVVLYEFETSMLQTMQVMRATRLLITPHGAGMSNLVFMRPGAAVLETNGYRCDYLGDYYGQLANLLNLHHRMWTEMRVVDTARTECSFNADITLDVREIVSISKDLLIHESNFRDAHFRDAVSKIRGLKQR